jgi:hypothetical protein
MLHEPGREERKLKSWVYKLLYSKWPRIALGADDRYSIVILTPGDLPFFMGIALETCAGQDLTHVEEIIVVPDSQIQPGFEERFRQFTAGYPHPNVRLARLSAAEIAFNRFHPNPFNNCWHQLVTGIEHATTRHILLHDVDLFLLEPGMLRRHFEAYRSAGVDCMGVSPVWDDWFRRQHLDHLVATWELMFDKQWALQFKPWQHRAHLGEVAGELHSCDMMLWPQAHTPADRIRLHDQGSAFVHFNHVTSTYRLFQKASGSWEDSHFRLLLIRILIDAYDPSGWRYPLPSVARLAQGLADASQRITYLAPETRSHYPEFRRKFEELLASGTMGRERTEVARRALAPFDAAFGASATSHGRGVEVGQPSPRQAEGRASAKV